jgi:8-oxo-dGTP pyrophosphatase MutT (NUDIX family)
MLIDQIQEVVSLSPDSAVADKFLARVADGALTRDENPPSHFCVYFLPYNSKTEQVFIVAHKKSGLWLSPGGHVDKGELLFETLEREMKEELGVDYHAPVGFNPFLLTITPIENRVQPCKVHYDIWYAIPTNGSDFNVDPREFHETRWLTIAEARKLVIDPPNLEALAKIEEIFAKAPAL